MRTNVFTVRDVMTGDTRKKRAPGLWEEIHKSLQRDIIFGILKPRQRLVEDEIIAKFKATRHAVRRAFGELERLGLVTYAPNKGVQVRDYTRQEVENLYEVRGVLEHQAAMRMRLPADAALVEKLTTLAAEHEVASREERYFDIFQLNNTFHETLFGACGNAHLAELIKTFTFATHPIRSRGFPDEQLRLVAIKEHFQMIEMLRSDDNGALARLCVEHIQWPKRFYLQATQFESALESIAR